ncbi:MAG: ATP-binding protein [Ruminococcus sp.]|nr:ATP-binding protein [Candidatus Copronaster equi]
MKNTLEGALKVKSKTFPASVDSLNDALAFVEEELESLSCSLKSIMQISVCVEEMFVNVAHYAYNGESGEVTLSIDDKNSVVEISLIDNGQEFNPLAKDDPDITLSAEDRQIGGLGIFMVKKSMDEVLYERKDEKNIFTMKKKF